MNCKRFENLITAFLDGELAGGDLSAFREHQIGCPSCRALVEDVTQAIAACGEMPEVEPPLELLSRAIVIPALNPAMDCARFSELVTEFLDGFLEASVYHAFEDHAKACDDCSDVLAGVALAVSACHSVHFSEELEVPESLVARIMAETTGAPAAAEPEGIWGRVAAAFRLYAGPLWAPRFATAAVIVTAFSMLVAEGGLAPASIYESAARVSSSVYTRSADLAARGGEVIEQVERIRSDVDEMFEDEGGADPTPADGTQKSAAPAPARSTAA
jgi:hypothetical protein